MRKQPKLEPFPMMIQTKVPDATPSVIGMYALNRRQALLATVRHNQLINALTVLDCYCVHNNLRKILPEIGLVETDEIYIGVLNRQVRYVFPVQARTGSDKQSPAQVEKDFAVCKAKFPRLICLAIGAQLVEDDLIALFSFENRDEGV